VLSRHSEWNCRVLTYFGQLCTPDCALALALILTQKSVMLNYAGEYCNACHRQWH